MVAKTVISHSTLGAGPPVVLLHGLFGSGANLGALARSLADRFCVYSLDLPNHGRSGWTDAAGPRAMSLAVADWLAGQGLAQAAFVGHSLGGKVAMELALAEPRRASCLVVADIAPVEYPDGGHDTVFAALQAVVEAGCDSREAAAAVMAGYLDEPGVIQFLLMSLRRGEGGVYEWRFNLEALRRDYAAIRGAPAASGPYPGPVLFVKGGASDYIQPGHRDAVLRLFPAAQVREIPGSGHWLHAEKPELFNSLVGRFLDTNAQPSPGAPRDR